MILECFFHFIGTKLTEYANAVIVSIYELNSLTVKVFWSVYYDFINKFVYQLRHQFLDFGYPLDLINKPL